MRPIDRGPVPLVDRTPKTVTTYRNWRYDLIDRIGTYCSFCNMPLYDSIQVEHLIAQDIDPARALDWDNMLLACGPCNRSKSNTPCPPTTHYLPQYHNTHLAFVHTDPKLHPVHIGKYAVYITRRTGTPALAGNAESTIDLCKLHIDTTRIADQVTDLRWNFRYQALFSAQLWRSDWDDWGKSEASRFISLLVDAAVSKGFWSIWFDCFSDVREIRKALVERFPGTAPDCFDSEHNPVPRNPTHTANPV